MTKIEWGLLIEEVKKQIELGKDMAAFGLGVFLEELKAEIGVDVP